MNVTVYTQSGSPDVLQPKELEITPLGGHITRNSPPFIVFFTILIWKRRIWKPLRRIHFILGAAAITALTKFLFNNSKQHSGQHQSVFTVIL